MAAEIAGLSIGAVALASLFSTCLELFNVFELASSYYSDYKLSCTKLNLLRARLTDWGGNLNIHESGYESPSLREYRSEENAVIVDSLWGIKNVLGDALSLVDKHGLLPRHSRTSSSTSTVLEINPSNLTRDLLTGARPRVSRWSYYRTRTVWAIRDKSKFDEFIEHLSFLIENLEKVTNRLDMEPKSDAVEVPAVSVDAPRANQKVRRSGESQPINEIAGEKSINEIDSKTKQKNSGSSTAVLGSLGDTKNPWKVGGKQTNSENVLAVLGGTSEEGAKLLVNHANEIQTHLREKENQQKK